MSEAVDLIIVGGGATGLAAAVRAAADGLSAVVLERDAPGGHVRSHARVEAVLGHPVGITGAEFTERTVAQATRFGAQLRVGAEMVALHAHGRVREIALADGSTIAAYAVIVATGVQLPELVPASVLRFAGSGVYFAVPAQLPESLRGQDVLVAGSAETAVRAALRLSGDCRSVTLLGCSRREYDALAAERPVAIDGARIVTLKACHEIVDAYGVERVEALVLRDRRTGRTTFWNAAALFLVGAETPRVTALRDSVAISNEGFVVTGIQVPDWSLGRQPYSHETSVPGVFAAGAVRRGASDSIRTSIEDGIAAARQAGDYLKGLAATSRSRSTSEF